MIRYASGSKNRRCFGVLPAPGPPWRNTAGIPSGRPLSSQYIECKASSRSIPLARGWISGKSPGAARLANSPIRGPLWDQYRRPRRLARFEVAMRLGRVPERVAVVDFDFHLARAHDFEQILGGGQEIVALGGIGRQGRSREVERALLRKRPQLERRDCARGG